jgi:hypothetical protein
MGSRRVQRRPHEHRHANGGGAKTYQVTGPVLEVTPTTITVQKGDDKWQIARDKSTKMSGEPKVGAKVTIYYRMVATEVEVKATDGASKADGDLQKKVTK